MWYVREMMSHLRQRSRWKVEFFSEEGKEGPESVFPLMALGDIVEERKEFMNPQSFTDTLLNYLGLENIASNTGDLVNYKQKYGEEIRSRSKRFYPNDVLYGRLRPYLNKVFLADINGEVSQGICSGEFYVLVPKGNLILAHFLRAMLASAYIQRHVSTLLTGTTLPRLQIDDLLEVKIPIPSLDEQRICEEFLIRQNIQRRQMKQALVDVEYQTSAYLAEAIELGNLAAIGGSESLSNVAI